MQSPVSIPQQWQKRSPDRFASSTARGARTANVMKTVKIAPVPSPGPAPSPAPSPDVRSDPRPDPPPALSQGSITGLTSRTSYYRTQLVPYSAVFLNTARTVHVQPTGQVGRDGASGAADATATPVSATPVGGCITRLGMIACRMGCPSARCGAGLCVRRFPNSPRFKDWWVFFPPGIPPSPSWWPATLPGSW